MEENTNLTKVGNAKDSTLTATTESGIKQIVPTGKYDFCYDFHEEMAMVKFNDSYGFIDKNGNEIISCKYFLAADFKEG